MSEYAVGQSVRTLVEITDKHGRERIPEQVVAMVIGFAGRRVVLSWIDESGENVDAVAHPWELLRVVPRGAIR